MGADIHVNIIEKNHEGKWKLVSLYAKENKKFKRIDPYPFRNAELFDILSGNEDETFPMTDIEENSLPVGLQNEIKRNKKAAGYYNFYEVNLADIKYYLIKHPKVRDYDYEAKDDEDFDKNGWKPNPLNNFIEAIENYLNFVNPYRDFQPASFVRIIYYFDC